MGAALQRRESAATLLPAASGGRNMRPVLNLILRHRERMAIVYGRVSPLPLAGPRFAPATAERQDLAYAPKRPGEIGFSGRHLLVRPLPRRARSA
jgi:hypothetical protein